MMRVRVLLAILVPHVVAEMDGCVADPDGAHLCHEDAASLLQLKMKEQAQLQKAEQAVPPSVPPGLMQLKVGTGKCLDWDKTTRGKNGTNGTNNVIVWECHDQINQQWFFQGKQLKSLDKKDMCLDWDLNSSSVIMWACHKEANQQWQLKGRQIQSLHNTSKCLDMDKSGNVLMWECHTGDNQQWSVNYIPLVLKSKYDNNASTTKCLDKDNREGSRNVQMWDCHTGTNQKWYLDLAGNLKAASKECLDWDNSTATGEPSNATTRSQNVLSWECHTGSNQKWIFDHGQLKSRDETNGTKCLDWDRKENTTNNVIVWPCHGGNNQKWYFAAETQS